VRFFRAENIRASFTFHLEFECRFARLLSSEAVSLGPIVRLRHLERLRVEVEAPPIQIFSRKGLIAIFERRPHIIDHLHFLTSFEI